MRVNNAVEEIEGSKDMYDLISAIDSICNKNLDDMNENERKFHDFAYKHLIYVGDKRKHLPIPVYSFMKPKNAIHFLTHILLSQGEFLTEIDLMTHQTLRDCFRYAKLIGDDNSPESLQEYSTLKP